MGRYALLVATGQYEDARLSRLRAPSQDVERLAALLEDPDVGGFAGVRVLRDAPDHEIRRAVEDVLASRTPDDLVLLYFSCHGLTTPARRLYFAAANTLQDRPAGTAIPRSFLNEQLEDCRAAGRILVLDCCFSGAFVEGFKDASATVLDDSAQGYVVLTASNAYEYAFEQDTLSLEAPRASLFTDVLIEGLSSGAADLDGDGWIDVNELFGYAHREVRRRRPDQTPQFFAQAGGPPLRVARAGGSVPAVVRRSASYTSGQLLVARGFRAAAEPVCRTLGPLGRRSVLFVRGVPVELADAAAIAHAFHPDDPRDTLGASYVRELVEDVHRAAGDGAASAVAVAQGAILRLVEAMRDGHNPVRLMRGVQAAGVRAAELIAEVARPLENPDVTRLATASSGSAEIGAVVGQVMAVTGRGGALLVEPTRRFGLDYEITRGLRFPGGYASPESVTDRVRREAVLESPQVFLHRGRLTAVPRLIATGQFLVVCEEVADSALTDLVLGGKVVVTAGADVLARLSTVVGGRVLDPDLLLPNVSQGVGPEDLGRAAKVVVTETDTTVIGLPVVGSRVPEAAPAAGVILAPAAAGIIRAPAADVERVRGAVRTVRGAVAAGVLRGAAVGLREVGERLAAEATGAPAEVAGWKALAGALSEPSRWIAENAAVDVSDLDPTLIDSAATARAVVAAAGATAARFLLVA
ncbi:MULTISPECIES: caspase, EACC1-associated type [unclassified Saccharothrix]|uniref:caspase, EACC1-associated type n=1 Tax=unclassified Saccharothrix TaxID=2593673 RepID=UPI00307F57EB